MIVTVNTLSEVIPKLRSYLKLLVSNYIWGIYYYHIYFHCIVPAKLRLMQACPGMFALTSSNRFFQPIVQKIKLVEFAINKNRQLYLRNQLYQIPFI